MSPASANEDDPESHSSEAENDESDAMEDQVSGISAYLLCSYRDW